MLKHERDNSVFLETINCRYKFNHLTILILKHADSCVQSHATILKKKGTVQQSTKACYALSGFRGNNLCMQLCYDAVNIAKITWRYYHWRSNNPDYNETHESEFRQR